MLDKANSNEAKFTKDQIEFSRNHNRDATYYKKGSHPGVEVSQSVIDYAPESPTPKGIALLNKLHVKPVTTSKTTVQLDKLRRIPFGVLTAHGGEHMSVISYGKVIEVHWRKPATDPAVIEVTDLENWAIGPQSGFHYYASGVIVAPAADVDVAFRP